MDVPEPTDLPIKKIRDYLSNLRDAVLGIRPIAGNGIRIDEYPGKGAMISTTGEGGGGSNACLTDAGDPPASGTYVLGSVDGTCQWISTTTCP